MRDERDITRECGNNVWRNLVCEGRSTFCVNCGNDPCRQCPGEANFILRPCRACQTQHIYSAIVALRTTQRIAYPEIRDPLQLEATRTSIRVTANMTEQGFMYCAAFKSNLYDPDAIETFDVKVQATTHHTSTPPHHPPNIQTRRERLENGPKISKTPNHRITFLTPFPLLLDTIRKPPPSRHLLILAL